MTPKKNKVPIIKYRKMNQSQGSTRSQTKTDVKNTQHSTSLLTLLPLLFINNLE